MEQTNVNSNLPIQDKQLPPPPPIQLQKTTSHGIMYTFGIKLSDALMRIDTFVKRLFFASKGKLENMNKQMPKATYDTPENMREAESRMSQSNLSPVSISIPEKVKGFLSKIKEKGVKEKLTKLVTKLMVDFNNNINEYDKTENLTPSEKKTLGDTITRQHRELEEISQSIEGYPELEMLQKNVAITTGKWQ